MYKKKEFNYIKYQKKEYRFNLYFDKKTTIKEMVNHYNGCPLPVGLEYKNYKINICNCSKNTIKEI